MDAMIPVCNPAISDPFQVRSEPACGGKHVNRCKSSRSHPCVGMEFYKSSPQGVCTFASRRVWFILDHPRGDSGLDEASFSHFIPPFLFFKPSPVCFPSLRAPSAPGAKHMNHRRHPTPGYTKHCHCVCLLQRVKIINHCQLTKLPPRKCFPASHSLPRDGFIGKLRERRPK